MTLVIIDPPQTNARRSFTCILMKIIFFNDRLPLNGFLKPGYLSDKN